MNVCQLPSAKRIKVTWDSNKGKVGYLPNVRTIDAKDVDITITSWEYAGLTYFDMFLQWFSESARPLRRFEVTIFSGDITKLSIVQ